MNVHSDAVSRDEILFTIAVISYNNSSFLPNLLDSIIAQNYGNIELIVSDDCSDCFDEQSVERYIKARNTGNLRRVVVHRQLENLGTVGNANWCFRESKGDLFYLVAADDWLYDENVVRRFCDTAEADSGSSSFFSGQTLKVKDESLDNPKAWASEADIARIEQGQSDDLYSALCAKTIVPTTSTVIRRELLEANDGYDASYRLIEDAPLFLKSAREGAGFCWIPDFVAAYHRAGGVCHSGNNVQSVSYRIYVRDRMRLFSEEVFAHADMCLHVDIKKMLAFWRRIKNSYIRGYCNHRISKLIARALLKNSAYIPFCMIRARTKRRLSYAKLWKSIRRVRRELKSSALDR